MNAPFSAFVFVIIFGILVGIWIGEVLPSGNAVNPQTVLTPEKSVNHKGN